MMLDRDSVLWFAGLFEGEGFFRFCPAGRRSMGIAIKMTDEDVLLNAQRKFGGHIWRGAKRTKPTHKQSYRWMLDKRDKAYALLIAIYPFLGERRKSQTERWVSQYAALKPAAVQHGTRHAYAWRGCRCAACTAANTKYYRARREATHALS